MPRPINRRLLWVTALLVSLMLSVSACGSSATAPSTTPTEAPPAADTPAPAAPTESSGDAAPAAPTESSGDAAPSGDPIKIGCSLPETGAYAETGVWVKRGYEQWVADMNANGGLLGRPVELTIYDDESKVENAVNLMNRVITVDNVDLICGGYPGTSAAAQMAVAEKNQKVYVSMGGHMASFMQNYTYSFGAPPLMGQWWYEGLFDWLETVPAAERPARAAIFTMNNPIGAAVLEPITNRLVGLGIEVVADEKYDLPLADATPLIAKAKAADADMFFSNGLLADGAQTIRAMKALGYNPKLIAQGIGTLVPAWTQELGADGNYVFSGTALHDKLPFEGIARLNQVAAETYQVPTAPTYFLFGYAWAQALERGVEGAQTLDQTAIRDWLKSHEISTIGGKFSFDEQGLPPAYTFLTQVIDGKVELIWPPEVQTHKPVYPKPDWES
ncbi:ABC transporter substrate-binding protein [Chloroflexales bacterium ZM16-3]|nr:ABC transporter substrate-binding protein [Chloroflexales bacterium ZM16-3]